MLDHLAPRPTAKTINIETIHTAGLRKWTKDQSKTTQNWMKATHFKAKAGSYLVIPDRDGHTAKVLVVLSEESTPWDWAELPSTLPKARYRIVTELNDTEASNAALGWALGTYRFDRYKEKSTKFSDLVWPENADQTRVSALASAIALGRDLITTPAGDMGPEELAETGVAMAKEFGGKAKVIKGKKLLDDGYPAIHAVGRASSREPRLLDFTWGKADAPKVTLVGKGVCFDTGGLDLKPPSGMKLMKKDMGGAATVLALAKAIMMMALPVRLRVLIPCVENSVSGDAFRPLDVLQTRKGLTVEVGNTDAEGRLVLCDALAEACAESPDLVIDIATLTGAARVALGTELPALFTNDDAVAAAILEAGMTTGDPLWRMPLHDAYRKQLDSAVADLNNISSEPYGGAITAALFLREFVTPETPWVHIDTMAYNLRSRPGRPSGGETFALRALLQMLESRFAAASAEV